MRYQTELAKDIADILDTVVSSSSQDNLLHESGDNYRLLRPLVSSQQDKKTLPRHEQLDEQTKAALHKYQDLVSEARDVMKIRVPHVATMRKGPDQNGDVFEADLQVFISPPTKILPVLSETEEQRDVEERLLGALIAMGVFDESAKEALTLVNRKGELEFLLKADVHQAKS